MAKYCKAYKLRVTYLDCMECEDKQCKYGRTWATKDCELCTKYGKCELTERRQNYGKALSGTRTRTDSIRSIRK